MKNKILASVILFCMLFSIMPIAAFAENEIQTNGTCGENLTWVYEPGLLTISGTGDMADYVAGDQPWCQALLIAWYNDVPVKVVIEDGVTSIGVFAFGRMDAIYSVELPESILKIGDTAFGGIEPLTDITIPENVNYIGVAAFANTGITSAIIPDNQVQIMERAFSQCPDLEKLVIPASAVIDKPIIDSQCQKLKTAGPIGGDYNFEFGWTDTIPAQAFYECGSIETVVLPDTITSIGEEAFNACGSLQSITLSASLKEIQRLAFGMCDSLNNVIIPDGVKIIGDFAFSACGNLNKITLPDGLETIGDGAFNSCGLTSIKIPNGITAIGDDTFRFCYNLENISLGNNIEAIGDDAFWLCTSLTSIHIPHGTKSIGEYAFRECTSLEKVSLPTTLKSIEFGAFQQCTSLTDITIPNGITTLYARTFNGCSSLTEVILPATLELITGAETFRNCPLLESIYFCGDAPNVKPADNDRYAPFDATKVVLYYLEDKEGWSSPTWNGYNTNIWDGIIVPAEPDEPILPEEPEMPIETVIVDKAPINGATNVGYDAADLPEFYIQFNKVPATMNGAGIQIDASKEPFAIYRASDDALIWEDPSADLNNPYSTKMVINKDNTIVTVTPTNAHALLEKNTEYYITMGKGYIKFEDGSTSPAIEKGEWSFKTKNPDISITQNIKIRTGDDDKPTAMVGITWKDSWFDNSSNYYMHDLATAAMGLSGAAYVVGKNGIPASESIYAALEGFGFADIESYNYEKLRTKTDNDVVSYSFARKTVEDNGVPYELIVIAVKGTSGDEEWYSNFNVGTSGNSHDGFETSKDDLMNHLDLYLEAQELDNKVLKFLVTGHSRGAAVSNLTAKELTAEGYAEKRNIYSYNFATPAVTTDNNADSYNNIFNINSAEDFVTRVPLSEWKFKRYGIDLLLPSRSFYGTGYDSVYNAMSSRYYELVEKEFEAYDGTQKVDGLVADVYRIAPNVRQFYEHKSTTGVTPYDYFSALADGLVTGNFLGLLGASFSEYSSITGFFVSNQALSPRVLSAHAPAAYFGWIDSCTAEELFGNTNSKTAHWFKRAIIACPVDVYVYDEAGNLVASVEDETVQHDSLAISVENGVKTVDLPGDQEYSIKIIATGDGSVDYTVSEYMVNGTSVEEGRVVEFNDIEITAGDALCGNLDNISNTDGENYALTKNDNETIYADYDSNAPDNPPVINPPEPVIETTAMYRLYNPNSGEHFYTGSVEERDMLDRVGWNYEGVAWNAPTNSGDPVYRLFNPNSGDHHYTMSAEERDMLVDVGWNYEGVAWNSASNDNVPQYRLYNPNADCGSHHYTSSIEERDFLVSLGWILEGIGWFGIQ